MGGYKVFYPTRKFLLQGAQSFYSLRYAGDIIEVVGNIFAQSSKWLESIKSLESFINEKIIDPDKSSFILRPRFHASRDVLDPSSANITRLLLLGTIQILKKHVTYLSSILNEKLESLIFTMRSFFQDPEISDPTELFKPYKRFGNFFSTCLNENIYKALEHFLADLYGDSLDYLNDERMQFYQFLKDISIQKLVEEAIENLQTNLKDKGVISICVLISCFKEGIDSAWYGTLKKIQPILSLSRRIEDSSLVFLMMNLNAIVYLNCGDPSISAGFKKNLFDYHPWLYKDTEMTFFQVSYVEMACAEDGGVKSFAEWMSGLIDQKLNGETLNRVLYLLKELKKHIKFEERALVDKVIDKINIKI